MRVNSVHLHACLCLPIVSNASWAPKSTHNIRWYQASKYTRMQILDRSTTRLIWKSLNPTNTMKSLNPIPLKILRSKFWQDKYPFTFGSVPEIVMLESMDTLRLKQGCLGALVRSDMG